MIRARTFPLGMLLLALGFSAGLPARADDEPAEPVRIVLHPAAEPQPALKYRLLPEFLERLPGNSAVDYGKVKSEQTAFFADRAWWEENVYNRLDAPVDQLRNAPSDFIPYAIWQNLQRASRRETCDWQLPIREDNDFFATLLPHTQEMRFFARLVAARARVQIARGEYAEALETLKVGFAMAEDIGGEPTLVSGLVGIAIAGIMSDQVELLLQQPDAPNLYWALTLMPRPLVDLRPGIEAEMNAVALSLPQAREVTTREQSAEQWREDLRTAWAKVLTWHDHQPTWENRPEFLVAMGVRGYPIAKAALIRRGMPADEVEAMPVAQVMLIHIVTTYERLRDDVMKWFYVPYAASRAGAAEADRRLSLSAPDDVEVIPLARVVLPAVSSVQTAIARSERKVALLRTFEAIRMYGALHGGKMPPTLAQLPVPAPDDPFTAAPFHYELHGEEALIAGPPAPGVPCRYLVRLEQP